MADRPSFAKTTGGAPSFTKASASAKATADGVAGTRGYKLRNEANFSGDVWHNDVFVRQKLTHALPASNQLASFVRIGFVLASLGVE